MFRDKSKQFVGQVAMYMVSMKSGQGQASS